MLRAIGRVIRDRYEQRAWENSTAPFLFNIMIDPRYVFHSYVLKLFFFIIYVIR
jgi:hypothetical protein